MKKITTIFSAIALLLSSCQKDGTALLQKQQGEPFTTQITLAVEDMTAGTNEVSENYFTQQIQTRSSLAEEPSTEIKNLWVIQFGGDGNVAGEPKYIPNYGEGDGLTNEVKLIPSLGVDNTIVYLANTFKDDLLADLLAEGLSLENLGSLSYNTVDEEGCFTSEGTSKYMVMSGSLTCPITPSEDIGTCTLKRNVAKITLKVENSAGLTFNSISLKGIPNKLLYYTNRATALPNRLPENGTFTNIIYKSEEMAGKSEFTFYVPINMRGVVNNDSEQQKNHFAPSLCTYAQVLATTTEDEVLGYTLYLGGNLINDFNIEPNKHYHYTLNFEQEGQPDSDLRIENLSSVDFTQPLIPRSNCYILNPSSISDVAFYIPIDRIDEFWSDEVYVEDESARTNNVLTAVGDNWEVVMLWHDSQTLTYDKTAHTLGGLKLEKATSPAGEAAVKVTLPTTFTSRENHCNVAYVVRKIDSEEILWSWHLWITDYDPYPDNLTPSMSIYQYQVDGGELHRYDNDIFNTGIYCNKLIMDRDLGARSADFEGHGSIQNNDATYSGTLYYQFGRKDPFPRITTYYLNDYTYETVRGPKKFEYAVNNPSKFVSFLRNWCSNASGQTTTNIWNDYKIEVARYTSGKSIFDPSPLGFRLPINRTWSGFSGSNQTYEQANPNNYTFPWTHYFETIPDEYKNGRLYKGFDYFPASGYRTYYNGSLGNGGNNGFHWSATPSSSSTNGYYLIFSSSSIYPLNSNYRAHGCPVRPVQE